MSVENVTELMKQKEVVLCVLIQKREIKLHSMQSR